MFLHTHSPIPSHSSAGCACGPGHSVMYDTCIELSTTIEPHVPHTIHLTAPRLVQGECCDPLGAWTPPRTGHGGGGASLTLPPRLFWLTITA
eukprot:4248101-Prymnesium_polylepis.1